MKRIRLRTKFLLLFSIIALIPLILTLSITYTRFQHTLEQDAIKLENQLAATASNKVKTFIVSQVGILDTIATLYDQEFARPQDSLFKIVENILYRSENFTNISIVDKDGKEIIKQDRILVFRESDLGNILGSEAFESVKTSGLYIGPMYIENGKPLFNLGRWIVDSQENFLGAVFAKVDAKIIPEVMANISTIAGEGGRVFMVDERGVVVAHSDLSYILGEKDLSALPIIENIVLGNEDIEISKKYENEEGEAVLASAYPITIEPTDVSLVREVGTNWFVIVEQQQNVVFAEAYKAVIFFIIIALGVLALIITSAVYFAGRISAPVEALYRATVEFAKGNLTYRTKIKANDEIGDLAKNFDEMAGTIAGSIEKIKEEERMKSEFVTITAHQLRTPLTGLKWSLDLISSGGTGTLSTDQKQVVDKASTATNHMVDLVNNLLNITQIEEGGFPVTLKKQSIVPVFTNIKDTFQSASDQNGVTLKMDDIPALPPLDIDSEKVEMALENIIDNSIKYSRPGGVVEVKVVPNERGILISIQDSGIGISPSEAERIFTKFFRSDRALHHHTDGTGIGLYVAKNIIEQHKGKVWFESKVDQGTTFYVSLPLST